MPEWWTQVQEIASAVLLVSTIIAASIVGALVGTNKTLRETVTDRGVRITDLEGQVDRTEKERDEGLERERAAREVAVAAERAARLTAEGEAAILKSMVTGKVELIALGDLLEEHHRQAVDHWTGIDGHIQEIPQKIVDAIKEDL